jgi:hypothetical protein
MTKLPRTTRRFGLVALAAIPMLGSLALSSTTALASAATAKSGSVVSSQSVSVSAQAQTLAYWTQARRDAAKSVNVVAGGAPPTGASPAAGTPSGPPSVAVGSPPSGTPAGAASPTAQLVPASQPVLTAQPWTYPFPYDAFAVRTLWYEKYPFDVNGTIFFTNGGDGYKCSGTSVVNGHHPSEVWTAGHCVASTEEVNKEFDSFAEFIPAYNGNGTTTHEIEPYGTFVANGYETATAWLNSRDLTVDFGAITLNNNQKGKKLSGKVGTDGFAWNQPENEQFVQFGYPGESPYNGTKMEENIAATAEDPTISGGSGGKPTGTGSPFTGGSSGGAWNIDWTDEGPGYINGHTDFYYTEKPLTKFSPYINTLANEVRCLGKPSEC